MNKVYGALIVLVVVIGAIAVLIVLPSPKAPDTPAQAQTKNFDLVVAKRKLISGSSVLSVNEDDKVTINITVDEDEELHLHGYNLHVDLEKGKPGSLSFTATTSGRFPYELEHSSTEIGALEVQPK